MNAAGITDRGAISDTTPELFERMMAVNLRAPFFLIQDAAAVMRRERIAGTIVNILSMSAHGGQPFLSPYSISKGALATLTKNAAFSLMPWRIRVNGLNLGWMDTPGAYWTLPGTPLRFTRSIPAIGEHSLELLREAGFSNPEVADMISAGLVAARA